MPKSFTESEKAFIRDKLLQEAEACLALYGIRKTTVDELVRRVKIPKGTFYLFYESKEALIFDVLLKYNTTIQEKLFGLVAALPQTPDADALTDIIFNLYRSLDGSFLLRLVETGELEMLMHHAPPEFVQANMLDDEQMMGRLMTLFPAMAAQKTALYSAALRGIFLMLLYKDKIAYDHFDEMLRLVIRGVVGQMFGENQ